MVHRFGVDPGQYARRYSQLCALSSALLFAGCAADRVGDWRPALVRAETETLSPSSSEVRRLQLVGADLVAVLVQLPDFAPDDTTLQVSVPVTPFGLVLVRALEDAGYGLQRVSADQGAKYVGYRRRVSQTDAGQVLDYGLSIGKLTLSREYTVKDDAVFPASLMVVEGIDPQALPSLDDSVFREQGGDMAFVTGIRDVGGSATPGSVRETHAADGDELPLTRRTDARDVVADARRRAATRDATAGRASFDPDNYLRLRRTVLIFDAGETMRMGAGNKEAVRLLARDTSAGDVFVITACTDADGRNSDADARGLRVRNEFLAHGVAQASVQLAPCMRASFRHATDDSPVPVEIVQHRSRT